MTLGEISDKDMQHCHFLKSTCDIGDPPIKGPRYGGERGLGGGGGGGEVGVKKIPL